MSTDTVKHSARTPESEIDGLVELGAVTKETKGPAFNFSYDGGLGYFF